MKAIIGRNISANDLFNEREGKYIDLTTPEKLYDYLVRERG